MQHYTSRVSQIPIIIPRLLNPDYWHWRVAYLSLARAASSETEIRLLFSAIQEAYDG